MTLTIGCSSNVFHVSQPDTYWNSDADNFEEQENDSYEYYREELITDNHQPSLLGGFVQIKRKNLPVGHPEYAEEGYYQIRGNDYLDKYLGEAWFSAFEELLQDTKKKTGIRIKLVRKGTHSPQYYNYGTDWTNFDLLISKANLKQIVRIVFKHKEIFEEYCYKYHKSYQGIPLSFASHMPYHSLTEWQEYFNKGEGWDHWEKACWMLLEFFLFAYPYYGDQAPSLKQLAHGLNEWEKEYESQKEDLYGNGVIADCCDFLTGEKYEEWKKWNCPKGEEA
jgi:hypothetical protein